MTSRGWFACKGFSFAAATLLLPFFLCRLTRRWARVDKSVAAPQDALLSLSMDRGEAIVLVGFMGTGKSSIGRHLAYRMKLPRYDTDEMVRARFGLKIAEIFARFGEAEFRAAETEALAQIPARPAILVTGGGIVLRQENVATLRMLGIVVRLAADEETLFERVSRRPTRPLLQTENPRATLSEMLRLREPLYHAAADFTVDTSTLGHEEVAQLILKQAENVRSISGNQ